MGILLVLLLTFIGFYITYLIIKIAVKHAISESLEDIRGTMIKAISQSRDEYNWKNNKE